MNHRTLAAILDAEEVSHPNACRFLGDPDHPEHVCRDSFGYPVHGNKICHLEAQAQLVDQRDSEQLAAGVPVGPWELTDRDLTTLLELAIANPCRSDAAQRILVDVAGRIDNVFTTWSAWAAGSRRSKPCSACTEPMPVGRARLCSACITVFTAAELRAAS